MAQMGGMAEVATTVARKNGLLAVISVLKTWLGKLSGGMGKKWKRIFKKSQVNPEGEVGQAGERQLNWVGEGFYVEDIFGHMISEMKGETKTKKKKRFGFKTVAKVSRMAAASTSNKMPKRHFTFKSVAKVSRLLGGGQGKSTEEG